MKFCLRGMLGEDQGKSLFKFLTALQKMLIDCVTSEYLGELEKELNKSLALLKRDFPISLQVSMPHSLYVQTINNLFLCILRSSLFIYFITLLTE